MARPRRPTKRRGKARSEGRSRSKRAAPLDPERIVGALAARGRRGVPATQLLRSLGADRGALRSLRRMLRELDREGRVEKVRGGWRVPRADGLVEAAIVEGSERGGVAEDDRGQTYRLRDTEGAKPGDRVVMATRGGRADVLGVVSGGRDHWVGILQRQGSLYGIGPYRDEGDWWLRVAKNETGGAEPGDVVVAVPAQRPGRKRRSDDVSPWARVTERLGRPGEPDADFAALVWRHRLPTDFSEAVRREVDALRDDGDATPGRRDLRQKTFVTIDPATARDHDDAVCVERAGNGFVLWVAIADVAHWVAPGSAIDREALFRGNSVYFPDRAIPMLPERLSSDLCSLVPDADRRVMVVELHADARGRVTRRRFHPGLIRSCARLSYEEAARAIEDGRDDVPCTEMLRDLGTLTRALRKRRVEAGSLDFELPTPVFRFDAHGQPVDAQAAPRNDAHRAIEEAMLAANQAVAEFLIDAEVEAVHRIHEPPAPRDRERLVLELTAMGLLEGGDPDALSAHQLAQALERSRGHPAERWIQQLALRSMRQARYSARSSPHFALAFEAYLHFTSPIRRYADLAVHRALKAHLAGDAPALRRRQAENVAVRASYRERVAVAAEREMDQLKACVLLRQHLGEEHDGTVAGLARHGLYVRLDRFEVEGLVHVSRLPDHYELDASGRALQSATGRYALGDRVRVRVAGADPVLARVDFELLDPPRRGRRRGGG
ncbi:MAG: VacB/RNase II family 3'-5' exoribonuclease [Myxococcota bacterium]